MIIYVKSNSTDDTRFHLNYNFGGEYQTSSVSAEDDYYDTGVITAPSLVKALENSSTHTTNIGTIEDRNIVYKNSSRTDLQL